MAGVVAVGVVVVGGGMTLETSVDEEAVTGKTNMEVALDPRCGATSGLAVPNVCLGVLAN